VAAVDQLARILGPDWQTLRWSQLAERSHALEQAAQLARALGNYMGELEVETAGEALERLQAGRS
jgi:hypothetical protein